MENVKTLTELQTAFSQLDDDALKTLLKKIKNLDEIGDATGTLVISFNTDFDTRIEKITNEVALYVPKDVVDTGTDFDDYKVLPLYQLSLDDKLSLINYLNNALNNALSYVGQ